MAGPTIRDSLYTIRLDAQGKVERVLTFAPLPGQSGDCSQAPRDTKNCSLKVYGREKEGFIVSSGASQDPQPIDKAHGVQLFKRAEDFLKLIKHKCTGGFEDLKKLKPQELKRVFANEVECQRMNAEMLKCSLNKEAEVLITGGAKALDQIIDAENCMAGKQRQPWEFYPPSKPLDL